MQSKDAKKKDAIKNRIPFRFYPNNDKRINKYKIKFLSVEV
jgi:hypothetical protein